MQRTQLQTSELGTTGLEITASAGGSGRSGGGWEFGWGAQDDEGSLAAIERAIELGVNWIDTGAAYGFGRSETVVGRALAQVQSGTLTIMVGGDEQAQCARRAVLRDLGTPGHGGGNGQRRC